MSSPHDTFSILEVFDSNNTELDSKISENDTGAMMVSLNPDLREVKSNTQSEIIFLIDRSGSMAGSRIEQAKNALQLFLRALPIGTLFNIWGFGSSYGKMKTDSIAFSNKTLKETSQYVNNITANLGGTEIYPPLRELLQPSLKEIPRQIIILTDGEVNNTNEVLEIVEKRIGDYTRIFTFGIGEACQRLVSGIALNGKGKACFVNSGERIEEIVMEQLQYILQPVLTKIEVDWGSLPEIERPLPLFVPPLYSGSILRFYTFLRNLKDLPTTSHITIKGYIGEECLTWKLAFELDNFKLIRGSIIHKLTAQNIISNMEKEPNKYKEEIISLGTKYSIASKHTAFIATTENTDTPVTGGMESVYISPKQSRIEIEQERTAQRVHDIYKDMAALIDSQSDLLDSIEMNISSASMNVISGQNEILDATELQRGLLDSIAGTISSTGKSIGDFFSNMFGSPAQKMETSSNSPQGSDHFGPQTNSLQGNTSHSQSVSKGSYNLPISNSISTPTPGPRASKNENVRPFDTFIILQKADGSFSLKKLAEDVFRTPLPDLIAPIPLWLENIIQNKKLLHKVWATALAIICMENKFPDERSQWVLLQKKCQQYIVSIAPSVDMKTLLDAAQLFYKRAFDSK
eukprot:TRINITY_DN7081_c0_g2_i1.p1 TRINITY_DN7081_c0_g2~~TRINITY_DN7081_c0_g2_i1.p1  ORF type:complete len:682 (+),score=178.76 TRINITY_DN7081_c0_g2_i1:152-2047(+)